VLAGGHTEGQSVIVEGEEIATPRDSLDHSDSDTEVETGEVKRGRLSPAAAS